jgi:hypothetical protein
MAPVVGDQAFIAGTILSQNDGGLADPVNFGENALNLAQFDAETVELYLLVEPP